MHQSDVFVDLPFVVAKELVLERLGGLTPALLSSLLTIAQLSWAQTYTKVALIRMRALGLGCHDGPLAGHIDCLLSHNMVIGIGLVGHDSRRSSQGRCCHCCHQPCSPWDTRPSP